MEELALLLAELLEDELFASSVLIISQESELLSAIAFDIAAEAVLDEITLSYEAFKAWSVEALPSVDGILNGIVGLQMVYQMIAGHRETVLGTGRTIDVEVALEDIEGTLVENYGEVREAAEKLLNSAGLSASTRASLERTASTSSAAYWESAAGPIRAALMRIPMYSP